MDVKAIGFIILVIGTVMLIFSTYLNIDWLPYLSVAILIVGGLVINYERLIG